MRRPPFSPRFSLPDGGALVVGAGLAAVHLRRACPRPGGPAAWCLLGVLFCWLTLTAAGPFVYAAGRLPSRSSPRPPSLGARLWLVWGLPWVGSGLVEAVRPAAPADGRLEPVYVGCLGMGLFLATALAVPLLAARLLWGGPDGSSRDEAGSWSSRVGLGLSAAWPIQVAVGLLLIG